MYEKNVKNESCSRIKILVFLCWCMTYVSGLGFDLRSLCLSKDLLRLTFDKMSKKYTDFDISDHFQHLASIEHTWIPKQYG